MSDTLSLTLPKQTSRTRVRIRRPKRPDPRKIQAIGWMACCLLQLAHAVLTGDVVSIGISAVCFCVWHRWWRRPYGRRVYLIEWAFLAWGVGITVAQWL